MTEPWKVKRDWRGKDAEIPDFKAQEVLHISKDRTMWRYCILRDRWVQSYIVDLEPDPTPEELAGVLNESP